MFAKKHPDGTRVRFRPEAHPDTEGQPKHTGTVIYWTTDCWHRVSWDDPNPDYSFFNLERVFKPEQLEALP